MHGHRIAGALFAAVFLSAPIGTCFAQSRVVDRLQKDYVNCITDIPLPVNAQRQHFGSVWDALEATNHSLESRSVVEAVAAAALADYGYKMSHLGTCKRKHDALGKALATLDAGEQQAVTESINEDTWSLVKVTWAAAVTEDEMDLRRKHSHKAMPNEREWFVNSASALSKAVGDLADAQALNH